MGKDLNYKADVIAASNIIENPYLFDPSIYRHYSKIFNQPINYISGRNDLQDIALLKRKR